MTPEEASMALWKEFKKRNEVVAIGYAFDKLIVYTLHKEAIIKDLPETFEGFKIELRHSGRVSAL